MMIPLIFVIDDSLVVRKTLEFSLRQAAVEVISFNDGVEALRWMTTPEARIPNLVFVDISMPKMNGYEVIRRFKSKPTFANTIFVMLTRRDGIIDSLKSRLVGATVHMTKPFKTQDILKVVSEQLHISVSS
jgi:twitching motility two-component system response regulator PilG